MRRTRHVVLPVRSWQYIGLLIVSLACLTLGLVSRDREGHAGNLAGPELKHQAPHEVDACPNLNPSVKNSIGKPQETIKPINNQEIKVSESRVLPTSRKSAFSRSSSLDRLSESDSRNIRTIERSRTRVSDNEPVVQRFRESRIRTLAQSRDSRNSFATRLSRSRDLVNRESDRRSARQHFERRLPETTRFENHRLTEQRESNEIGRRQSRLVDQRDSLIVQHRTNNRDRRSLSIERRANRQEYREIPSIRREYRDLSRNRVPNHHSEMRERRSTERRMLVEQRAADRLEDRREDRRSLLNRSARFARKDIDRNNNLDRQSRERSLENRRVFHDRVTNQERGSRFSAAASRRDLVRDNRQTLSRSMDRVSNREILNRRIRSAESNERVEERRSSIRFTERREINDAERRKDEKLFSTRKSVDQATSRVSANRRDSRENAVIRENYRTARLHYDESANRERRERSTEASINRNSVDRREIARVRDRQSHEGRKIILQRSRDAERRTSERSERLSAEQRVNSRRLSERRIDDSVRSYQGSRLIDRRLGENSESRVSRGRILEKRSSIDSRRSSERRINDEVKSREAFRTRNRRVERNSELRDVDLKRRTISGTPILENKALSETQGEIRYLKERQAIRSIENRPTNLRERESIRHLRQRSTRSTENSSRSSSRRIIHVPDQTREQRTTERIPVDNKRLFAKWERNLQNARIERILESRAKIVPNSIKNHEFLKYPMTYDLIRQAFVVALCTVYGLSLYNGKKSFGSSLMQQAQRFIIW